jgi:hypothetical protein
MSKKQVQQQEQARVRQRLKVRNTVSIEEIHIGDIEDVEDDIWDIGDMRSD